MFLVSIFVAVTLGRHSVLILPSINASDDKYQALKVRQCEEADKSLNRIFTQEGFDVIPHDATIQAIAESRLDFTDSRRPTQGDLFGIGAKAAVQFVVFTEVVRTRQEEVHISLVPCLAGFASVRTWLVDVPNHRKLLEGDICQMRSTALGESGSERQTRAVRLAIESQLRPFLLDIAHDGVPNVRSKA